MSEERKRRTETPAPAPVATKAEEDAATIDLVDLMYRLLAGWKLIAILAVALALVVGVYTIGFVTPLYEATATIYVLSPSDSAIDMSDLQIGTALTSDYLKVFQMWEVHEGVISNLGLPYDYEQMRDMLSVKNDADTRMLDITITSPSPTEAASIANEYAEVVSDYIAQTMSTDRPNMVSSALVPANPVSPNKTRNILLGFIIGALIGVGIITVRMLLDDKYKTAEDIRKYTGLVTLAVIPQEDESAERDRKAAAKSGRRSA